MTKTVVIVDDSLTVRMDLASAFESAGYSVILCATGQEARDAMDRGPADVLVLDVLLPDVDGVELLRELCGHPATRDSVRLMLSTEAEIKDRIRGLGTGAHEYVGKPYDAGWLVARTSELLRQRRSSQSDGNLILIIDDSPTFRDALQHILESAGYAVVSAGSGEEGLRTAAARNPSAIVVDGQLPGIDGAAVIRSTRLDAALRGVPCVLLTGSEQKGSELAALDAGADAFVRKDEDAEVILAKLEAVLRRSSQGARREGTESLLGPKRLLTVDDSATYLNELADLLRADGYDVIPARSGEEALELLAVQPVDCVLLDLLMPGIGGQETCARIKAVPTIREIPVIMLTALEDRDSMLRSLGAGADDYISKSSELEVLKARVRAQLRRKQFEDETRKIRDELMRTELEAAEARSARELAEARAVLVDELEAKNAELEAFSYSVSHDLRAPLRSIDGFSQALLEDYSGVLDAQGMDYLGRVRGAAQRMGDLIDALLQLSRVGRAALARSRINLSDIARLVLAELKNRHPERSVEITLAEEVWADADRPLMAIVLDNLIGNAWKFTLRTEYPKISFFCEEREGITVYRVRDNGVGFDPTYADRLFRPFQRLHTEAEYPGTGIGLATVHRIIDRHGGRIWADSAAKAGTTFHFTLGTRYSQRIR